MARCVLFWTLSVLTIQVALACQNCVALTKAQKAMFRAHSPRCVVQSRASGQQVAALVAGDATDSPQLRRHVYCVLRNCKLIGKDGRPLKSGDWVKRTERKSSSICNEPAVPQSPEDEAWRLLLCSEQKDSHTHDVMAYARAV